MAELIQNMSGSQSELERHTSMRKNGLAYIAVRRAYNVGLNCELMRLDIAIGSVDVAKTNIYHVELRAGLDGREVAESLRVLSDMLENGHLETSHG